MVSWRDRFEGTWFIQELVKVFIKYAEKSSLYDMMLELNNRISKKEAKASDGKLAKMMSDLGQNTLRFKLYFDPGVPYKALSLQ